MAHLFAASILIKLHDAMTPINMIIYWILDAAEAKAAIENCPTVLLVALPESWILMELGKDLIEGWHLHLPRQVVELILDLLVGELFIPLLVCL